MSPGRPLDHAFVRARFPAFAAPGQAGCLYLESAGGSFVCHEVIERLQGYYRAFRVQPGYPYPRAQAAAEQVEQGYARLAGYLGLPADWIHLGPSTSQNLVVLAAALASRCAPGDELVISAQDHEANRGPWRRLAERQGLQLREWPVDPRSGCLDPAALWPLLGPRTRLVAYTHCSNLVAEVHAAAALNAELRRAGILSVVDGTALAAHGFPDLAALAADVYVFSLYKTFGPHQGLMALSPALAMALDNQGHHFNDALLRKRLLPAGPDHPQIAAAAGIADYFDALDAHHHPAAAPAGRAERVRALIQSAEQALLQPLLAAVAAEPRLRLLGGTDPATRAPTLALRPVRGSARALASALQARGLQCAAGHFYAVRLLASLGIDPADGVLRLSLAHYNTPAEIETVIAALSAALDG
ncbi:MAG TPA: aminotransferase class V-fold PLP-dependent enzyme [Nevskiaceae bacterium]|nr:aminotransferase class V-fold PLP-dependent enzyme [Nevskiaceae bacterium]